MQQLHRKVISKISFEKKIKAALVLSFMFGLNCTLSNGSRKNLLVSSHSRLKHDDSLKRRHYGSKWRRKVSAKRILIKANIIQRANRHRNDERKSERENKHEEKEYTCIIHEKGAVRCSTLGTFGAKLNCETSSASRRRARCHINIRKWNDTSRP